MYEVGKCSKHSHCRDPMESLPYPKNIKILKNGDGSVIEAMITLITAFTDFICNVFIR